jgi:hypothetical protein
VGLGSPPVVSSAERATYRALQAPVIDGVALGWGVRLGPDSRPQILTHKGSNGYWFAAIAVYPPQDTLVLMVTNFGNDVAKKSIEDLGIGLADRLKLPNRGGF